MKEYLKKLPAEAQDLICLAGNIAAGNNMHAYLVGGFVRDLILGVKNLDVDILIEGDGIEFAEELARAVDGRLIRHKRFGTATVVLKHSLKIDIATARKECYPQAACLPEVTPGTLKDDLARRDFTINAMAMSINRKDFGRLIDFFGGRDDLRQGKIRILHDLSFIDDPTRILRGIRFQSRYDFKLEASTLIHLKEAARLKMLDKVQPQRLRDELILILKEVSPLKPIKRLKELTGLDFISPRLSVSKKSYAVFNSIKNEINWFKGNYPRHRQLDLWLIYFMGLIDPLDINHAREICRRFVFRKGEEKRILSFKRMEHKIIRRLKQDRIKPSQIFTLLEPLAYEVILLLKAKHKNTYIQRHIADFFKSYNGMRISVSGEDLHRLGLVPGPDYQRIFAGILKAKLDGKARTREEELSWIKKLIRQL